jgi:hypothetical protein
MSKVDEKIMNFYSQVAESIKKRLENVESKNIVTYDRDTLGSRLISQKSRHLSLPIRDSEILSLNSFDEDVDLISSSFCELIVKYESTSFIKTPISEKEDSKEEFEVQIGNFIMYFRRFFSMPWKEMITNIDIYVE